MHEARAAGGKVKRLLLAQGFTSVLQRAIDTMALILEVKGQPDLPVTRDPALNERNYGRLQGLNKADVATEYGDEQVALWRRSFSARHPAGRVPQTLP